MKKTYKTKFLAGFGLLIWAIFALACSGANADNTVKSSVSSANSSNSAANSNAANKETTTAANVDTTPLKMAMIDLGAKDEQTIESYKGRILTVTTAIVENWDKESIGFSSKGKILKCEGDFAAYADAIKLFQDGKVKGWIYADVKGTLKEVKKADVGDYVLIKMENCILQKLEK